jgi:hypothetical protein
MKVDEWETMTVFQKALIEELRKLRETLEKVLEYSNAP